MKTWVLVLIVFFSCGDILGQDMPIQLGNPSFEGAAREGDLNTELPRGWFDCGFPGETVPDVHPKRGGVFNVTKEAFDGETYIGMVVRENDTWERISQRLSLPIEGGRCYEFSIALARSENYVSASRADPQLKKNYTTPAKFRIWGGSDFCDRGELLAESPLIVNTQWLKYDFRFEPRRTHTFIVLEVFYKTPTPFPYNGNVLVDGASPIVPIPCKQAPPPVAEKPQPKPPAEVRRNDPKPEKREVADSGVRKRIIKELDRNKLQKGQVIRIEQIFFLADSPVIVDSSFEVLNELYEFLAANRDVVIEIGGHTNGLPEHEYCDKLSTSRAKSVVDYLRQKGIPANQLMYKGYGKRRPIAPNTTEQGRMKNQRVEIKILSFNS
jgi:outer membrane protein OmpA-like peptidoglycan-associated protein